MDLYIKLFIFIVVMVPLSMFWHELGHLIGAKIVRATNIILTVGIGKPIFRRTFKNMTFVVRQFFFFHSLTETHREQSLSRKEVILITMMGPISSLVLSLLAYGFVSFVMPSLIVYLTFLFNLWIGFINLIPFKFNERRSDGYTIIEMMLKKI